MVDLYTPLKKSELVSWDDVIPNTWKQKPHVPNHQAGKNLMDNVGDGKQMKAAELDGK